MGHRLWLPAVAIHRLGLVEIAPSPHHCFRTAHPCAQLVNEGPSRCDGHQDGATNAPAPRCYAKTRLTSYSIRFHFSTDDSVVGYLHESFHGRVKTLRVVGYLPESFHGRVKTLRVVGYLHESFHGRVKTLRIVGYLPESFHGRVKTLRIVGYLPESFHVFRYLPDFCGIAYIMCTHSVYVAHICVLLRILFVCSIVFAPPLGQLIFMLRHLSCSCSVHRYAPLALP